jgi:hypothetical protein
MAAGTATSRTERGTVVPTETEKFAFATRGALPCRTMVWRIFVRCSPVRLAEPRFAAEPLFAVAPDRPSRSCPGELAWPA